MTTPTNEPPSDSTDDIVDAYYDTGAYLTDPTRPGATVDLPSISERVWCDEDCGALEDPVTIEELRAALEHWRFHSLMAGCAHGR